MSELEPEADSKSPNRMHSGRELNFLALLSGVQSEETQNTTKPTDKQKTANGPIQQMMTTRFRGGLPGGGGGGGAATGKER